MAVTSYQIATEEVDPSTTAVVDPQPKSAGIADGIEETAGDGTVSIDGWGNMVWEYTTLTSAELDSLLTSMGLTDSYKSRKVTGYAPRNKDRSFVPFYGRVKKPQFPNEGQFTFGFWRGVLFKFTRVREL